MKHSFYIYSMIKNERLYLEEWIAWHLKLGVTKILLIEDNGSESHKDIVDKFENVQLIKVSDILTPEQQKDSFRQRTIVKWFIDVYAPEMGIEWGLFIDTDEYLNMECSIDDFCEQYKFYGAVLLYWRCYNANGHYMRENGTHQELYKDDCSVFVPKIRGNSKYAVNIKRCHGSKGVLSLHRYYRNVDVFKHAVSRWIDDFIYEIAWIDHFMCRSYEDWLYKLKYRRNLNAMRDDSTFWEWNPGMSKEIAGKILNLTEK